MRRVLRRRTASADRSRIGKVAMMQRERDVLFCRSLVRAIDAIAVERRRLPLDAVDLVAPAQQRLGKIGTVLGGTAGQQRDPRGSRVPRSTRQRFVSACAAHGATAPARRTSAPRRSSAATCGAARARADTTTRCRRRTSIAAPGGAFRRRSRILRRSSQ
jgi:hypothetical protein